MLAHALVPGQEMKSQRSPLNLPGYYFDEEKNRYYKIGKQPDLQVRLPAVFKLLSSETTFVCHSKYHRNFYFEVGGFLNRTPSVELPFGETPLKKETAGWVEPSLQAWI